MNQEQNVYEEVKAPKMEMPSEQGTINLKNNPPISDAEWCFQFFNNEPVVFAWNQLDEDNSAPLVIELKPVENEGLTFTNNGMVFKIFPRPITEETKVQRQKQKEQSNALQQDMEAAKNK